MPDVIHDCCSDVCSRFTLNLLSWGRIHAMANLFIRSEDWTTTDGTFNHKVSLNLASFLSLAWSMFYAYIIAPAWAF